MRGLSIKKKKTGITYVYMNEPYWDKEKRQSRAKRTLLGKLEHGSGEIIPTRSYQKKPEQQVVPQAKRGPVPITAVRGSFYGASYLFDQIGQITGITPDLKACFPDSYKQILSIAYFLILEENNSLSRFPHWQRLHIHPYGEDIPSQRSSELFQSIDEAGRMAFFKRQAKRRIEKSTGPLTLHPFRVTRRRSAK